MLYPSLPPRMPASLPTQHARSLPSTAPCTVPAVYTPCTSSVHADGLLGTAAFSRTPTQGRLLPPFCCTASSDLGRKSGRKQVSRVTQLLHREASFLRETESLREVSRREILQEGSCTAGCYRESML